MAIFFRLTAMAHICTMYKLLQLHSVLQMHSFFLRNGSYHDMLPLERSRDYWLFGWEGKQLHFKQLCFVSKGKRQYVFHCQGPLFQDSIPSYSFCTGDQRPLEAQAQYMDITVRKAWVQVPALLCLLAGTLMNLTMIHFTKRKTVIILTSQ